MFLHIRRIRFTLPALLLTGLAALPIHAGQLGLARQVPGDARLYVEIRDPVGLANSPAGALLSDMMKDLTSPTTQPAASQPATVPAAGTQPQSTQPTSAPAPVTWRDRLAGHIGLTQPGMLELLGSGRLAVAADSWQSLSQAILVAQPARPAELGPLLDSLTPAAPAGAVRRYKLTNDHELAFDGTFIAIGRSENSTSLFARTLALWGSDHGVALADIADFRDRVELLPGGSQVLLFLTGRTRAGQGGALPPILWPAAWNQFQSLAATVSVTPSGITVETSTDPSRLDAAARPAGRPLLTHLPASTLLAWTHSIDYTARYRRLSAAGDQGTFSFYRGVLENGMPKGSLETALLSHLTGDTLIILSQVARPASTVPADRLPPLWVPAITVAIETTHPQVVMATMDRTLQNLLMLLNVQPSPAGPLSIERTPIGPGGGTIQKIPVGRLLRQKPGSEVLGQLQLSWTVSDGLLVAGTAQEAVRDLVLARRAQAPLLSQALPALHEDPPGSRTLLIAQPRLISDLLSSWAQTFSTQPGLILESDWWTQLHSVRAVSLYQLGAIPGEVVPRSVQIAFVVPDLPAADRLRAGDIVIAVEGQPLAEADAFGSLELLLAARPRVGAVQFKVIRDGCEELVEVPVALPPPPRQIGVVEFLQQTARVMRLFASARYSTSSPSPEITIARLELQFAPATAAR
jgi:hypothetical protein